MSGAIHSLRQYAFMAWCLVKAQRQLYLLPFIISVRCLDIPTDPPPSTNRLYDNICHHKYCNWCQDVGCSPDKQPLCFLNLAGSPPSLCNSCVIQAFPSAISFKLKKMGFKPS
jgi:hypothetical protein